MTSQTQVPTSCRTLARFRVRGLARSFARDAHGVELSPATKVVFRNPVPVLFEHDCALEIGRSLLFRCHRGWEFHGHITLDPDDRLHAEVLQLIQAGKIRFLSIGHTPGHGDVRRKKPCIWNESEIVEVSISARPGADRFALISEIVQLEDTKNDNASNART